MGQHKQNEEIQIQIQIEKEKKKHKNIICLHAAEQPGATNQQPLLCIRRF